MENNNYMKSKLINADIIGVDNLNRKIYFDDKYLQEDWLIHLMYEVKTDEIALTSIGLEFLKDFWEFEKIANILFDYEQDNGDFHISFGTEEKLVSWLNNYHTHTIND
jgi:hypothetical protein